MIITINLYVGVEKLKELPLLGIAVKILRRKKKMCEDCYYYQDQISRLESENQELQRKISDLEYKIENARNALMF